MSHESITVSIAGTGSCLPDKTLTNADLAKIVDTSDEWITTRTGIKERRIAEGMSNSDLATGAGRQALENAKLEASDIDQIIVATVTPDTLMPSTAAYVQHKLGATKAIAYDISAACSGFLYAMQLAENAIKAGSAENVLIIGSEKLSSFVDWNDRTTCVLFGDGAGAAVISKGGEGAILATEIGTDGSQTEILKIPGGGSNCPTTASNIGDGLASIKMEGQEVFKHAVNRMKTAANSVIEKANLQPSDIAQVIPHQANLRIIDAISKRLDVDKDIVFVNLDRYGNTSAAAVAIALDEAQRADKFKRGDHIVLVVFGAGLTWAASAIRW